MHTGDTKKKNVIQKLCFIKRLSETENSLLFKMQRSNWTLCGCQTLTVTLLNIYKPMH